MSDIQVMWSPSGPVFDTETGECVAARDWYGNMFGVGDMVVYSVGNGNSTEIAFGRVVSMKSEHYERSRTGRKLRDGSDEYRSAWDKVTVRVLTEKSSGRGSARTRPTEVKAMNITWVPQEFAKGGA